MVSPCFTNCSALFVYPKEVSSLDSHHLLPILSNLQTMLRASYQVALNGTNPVLNQPGISQLSKEILAMIFHDHIAYCFDHVRQGII